MNRRILTALVILLIVCTSTASAAPVESTHISKAIGDGFFFEGDVVIPPKLNYATYEIRYPDLTARDATALDAIADLLFRDRKAERFVDDARETDRSGHTITNNQSGDDLILYQYGDLHYDYAPSTMRYDPFLFRIIGRQSVPMEETTAGDLPFMPREQAELAIREAVAATGVHAAFDLSLLDAYSIDHSLLREIYEQQAAKGAITAELIEQSGVQSADDWSDADDCYVFNYSFVLDGLPILADYRSQQLSVPTTLVDLWGLPLMASGMINRAGIFSLQVQTADIVQENETRTILNWEGALGALENRLSQLIPPTRMEIDGGFVCYVPIAAKDDQLRCELTPVWIFPCSFTSEGRRFVEEAFLFNAFTGEELS